MSTSASDRAASVSPLLRIRDLTAGYGATTVLESVSLDVSEGSVTAVFGPNGAGKSTLLSVVMGMVRPMAGAIELGGRDVTRWTPHRVAGWGVGYSPQGRRMFPYLSAEENLRIGGFSRKDRTGLREDLEAFIERWQLIKERRSHRAGLLSGGEQQVVALGRAVMSKPRLLLLDEPSLGLAPLLVNQTYRLLEGLVREGAKTVVLVEQNVGQALRLADRVCVLVKGRVVLEAPASDVRPEDVAELYFRSPDPDGNGGRAGGWGEPEELER